MVSTQTINLLTDKIITIIGSDVIHDVSQLEMGRQLGLPYLMVDINLLDMTTDTVSSATGIDMRYDFSVMSWKIDVDDISHILLPDHKYCGSVSESQEVDPAERRDMRQFSLLEFAVYNNDLENTLFTLPYEVVISNGTANFQWYEVGHLGSPAHIMYIAPAYEGGVGEMFATHPSRVTHRGPVTRYTQP